jgi:hypothetical protein
VTINALSSTASTVVAGLGTQTYNLTTTGIYTLSCQSFLPYLAIGSQPQSTVPSPAIDTVTTVADVSGSLNSTYFTFYSAGNLYGFYVWYNINSAGVDPAPTGLFGIQVAAATSATANTIASDTIAAINANALASQYVKASGATNNVIISDLQTGTSTAAANGTASPGFSYVVTATGSYGFPAESGLNIFLEDNGTVLTRVGNPTPTQPLLNCQSVFQGTSGDVVTVVLTSLSPADQLPNAVKSIMNLFAGPL